MGRETPRPCIWKPTGPLSAWSSIRKRLRYAARELVKQAYWIRLKVSSVSSGYPTAFPVDIEPCHFYRRLRPDRRRKFSKLTPRELKYSSIYMPPPSVENNLSYSSISPSVFLLLSLRGNTFFQRQALPTSDIRGGKPFKQYIP